ncbi:uncharacterized protein LOC134223605 [Armigeres subalbatus]|uniref:uncharacterized protein LOC134223605 n=1 Tax=Armigeres subalbatus TaxID=124917 RepID=UPI002ED2EE12
MASINSLPFEVLEKVFSYLPFKDICNVGQVCHVWRDVQSGPIFQRRFRSKLQGYFRKESSPVSLKFLNTCRNLSIVQLYNNADNCDSEEQGHTEDIAEQNIANILFGTEELYSLQILGKYKSLKRIIQTRIGELSFLKELRVSFCYDGEKTCPEADDQVWLLKSSSLESFSVGLPYSVGPLQLEAPNLKELHLTVSCDVIVRLVEQYSKQLEVLEMNLFDIETLDQILAYSYPCLEQLELRMYDDKELQCSYAQTADRAEDDERSRMFTNRAPSLKKMCVQSNVVFYKIFPTWCSLKTSLESIELQNMEIDANILINVLLIQPLKNLTIQQCEIVNDLPGLHIRMVNLEQLKLVSVVNNVLLEHNFCDLKRFELVHGFKYGNDLLQKVFYNFTSVQHMKLHFRTMLDEDALLKLHQMKSLRSLELRATEVTVEHWNACQPLATVEQFTLSNCFMVRFSMFGALSRVFPTLKRLHVDCCHIVDDTGGADAVVDGSCERKLRQMLPSCIVSWHESVQITPLTLKQLLM